jgi:hypothetical protein
MLRRFRPRLTYANVVASIALFVALGGSSYAAVQLSKNDVRSKHIKNGQVKRADLSKHAVTSEKVKDGSLLSKDFKSGQLVAGSPGAQGPKGDTGAPGPKGDTGTVDTSHFYDKAASDSRFLATSATAADANLLDGRDSTRFLQGTNSLETASGTNADTSAKQVTVTCPGNGLALGARMLDWRGTDVTTDSFFTTLDSQSYTRSSWTANFHRTSPGGAPAAGQWTAQVWCLRVQF